MHPINIAAFCWKMNFSIFIRRKTSKSRWKIYEILIEIKQFFGHPKKIMQFFMHRKYLFHFECKTYLAPLPLKYSSHKMMPQRCILHVHLINTTRSKTSSDFLSNKERKTLSIWCVWNCCCIVLNNILWHFLALRSSASVAMVSLSCALCVYSPDSCSLYIDDS